MDKTQLGKIIWEVRSMNELRKRRNNKGVAIIEIVLILAILVALVVIFHDEALALVSKIWASIIKGASGVIG